MRASVYRYDRSGHASVLEQKSHRRGDIFRLRPADEIPPRLDVRAFWREHRSGRDAINPTLGRIELRRIYGVCGKFCLEDIILPFSV